MAASFNFNEEGITYNLQWHVGNNINHILERIKFVVDVWVDGHEAQDIYGINFQFENKYCHKLTGNEARLYILLMHEKWKSAQAYVDMEKQLNILMQGENNPNSN